VRVAPATTAPEESVIVPWIDPPFTDVACPQLIPTVTKRRTAYTLNFFIYSPNF
jgi:hypothetical protein